MSKFNSVNTNKTVNKCGHVAYNMANEDKFMTQVMTCLINEPKFYGDNTNELIELAEKLDPKFVAQCAVYARTVFNLRSVSHVLCAILAHREDGKQYVRSVMSKICLRADDVQEILGCYISRYGKPIPNSLKKGMADVMKTFDEYQIAKYNRAGQSVKFRDILRIAHPAPANAEQQKLFNEILNDTLPTPYTWETELSTKGNTREVWENLIASRKVGYMALLRNLGNIIKANPYNIDTVYNYLSNPKAAQNSKQLPFRFYSAYKALKERGYATSKVMDILNTALEASCENIEKIPGNTLIAIDMSGSMNSTLSRKSEIRCSEIASVIGAIANKICENAVVVTFDTHLKEFTFSRRNGILETVGSLAMYGGGTNIHLPLQWALNNSKITFDRMIMLSDNEINSGWNHCRYYWDHNCHSTCEEEAQEYRRTRNPNFWVHAVDLMGYGTQQFCSSKTNLIAGWSENVLKFINLAENGTGSLKKEIKSIEI